MHVVCCCDNVDCTVMRLSRREDVLETLCGIRVHGYVLAASTRIQARFRGFLLRRDKDAFNAAVALFFLRCRQYLATRRFKLRERAALIIQAYARGSRERNTRFGRLLRRPGEAAAKRFCRHRRATEKLDGVSYRTSPHFARLY